jgi:hypothetical protein
LDLLSIASEQKEIMQQQQGPLYSFMYALTTIVNDMLTLMLWYLSNDIITVGEKVSIIS